MYVYLTGASVAQAATHSVSICPAQHLKEIGRAADVASDWYEADGTTPKQIRLEFERGRCSVPENVGRYLIEFGIATKSRPSRLILPHSH